MKILIAVLAVLAVTSGASLKPRWSETLLAAFDELKQIVHLDEIYEVIVKYTETDEEVQTILKYLESEHFNAAVQVAYESEELREFVDWIDSTGVPIIECLHAMVEKFHWTLTPVVASTGIKGLSFESLLAEIEEIYMPHLEELMEAIERLTDENPEFQEFMARLTALQPEITRIGETPEFQQVREDLEAFGFGFDREIDAARRSFIGAALKITSHSETLPEAFEELMEILHIEEVFAIIEKYSESDDEVQGLLKYLESEHFNAAVQVAYESEELREFVVWIDSTGVPIIQCLQSLADKFHWTVITPVASSTGIQGRSIQDFMDEIEELVTPHLDEFFHAVERLTSENPQFQQLVLRIFRLQPELYRLGETPEFKQVEEDLEAMGIDVDISMNSVHHNLKALLV